MCRYFGILKEKFGWFPSEWRVHSLSLWGCCNEVYGWVGREFEMREGEGKEVEGTARASNLTTYYYCFPANHILQCSVSSVWMARHWNQQQKRCVHRIIVALYWLIFILSLLLLLLQLQPALMCIVRQVKQRMMELVSYCDLSPSHQFYSHARDVCLQCWKF